MLEKIGGSPVSVDQIQIDTISMVPELTTVLLLGSGLEGLAGFRKKFGKK